MEQDEDLTANNSEKKPELEDLLKDTDDISEPSCMDRILMYLEEIKDEDYLFMDSLVEKLRGEEITWHQPWYQKSKSLSRPLKDSEIDETSEPYRTDTICKAENEKILENWNEFRMLYDVPDKLICLARWKNKDKSRLPNTPEERARRFVIAYLARGLKRTTYQVYRHILTCYGSPVKGPYSETEEKIMQVCFVHNPDNAVTLLSVLLGREPRGIYKRLQQMFDGKPETSKKTKIKWTLQLATKFVNLLLKYTKVPLEELKYKQIEKKVWMKLEKKLECGHYIYLQRFWYSTLHAQVFVQENIKLNKLRRNVFMALKSSPYQVWTDIRWKELVKDFPDGLTHRFLYCTCHRVVYKMPDYLKRPLSEVADYALEKLNKQLYPKQRLKTLQFNENGELEKVRH